MLLRYNKTEYDEKIEYLRNNGYTVNNVEIDNDDLVIVEEGKTFSAEFELPNNKTSYKDFSAIIVWADYLDGEDDPDRPTASIRDYLGMPVPSTFTVDNGGTLVNCNYALEDTSTPGLVKITITVTNLTDFYNDDFANFMNYFSGIMFIEGDEYDINPDASLVVPNLESFFGLARGVENFEIDFTNKTKLLSLGDSECCCEHSLCKCYGIVSHESSSQMSDIMFDGTYYYVEDCSYKLYELPKGKLLNLRGYSAEDIVNVSETELYETAASNSSIFRECVTKFTPGCLYLQEGLIFPVAEGLLLKDNMCLDGNGSTIQICNESLDRITLINNSQPAANNVVIKNITFKGRDTVNSEPVSIDQGNSEPVSYIDQGIGLNVDSENFLNHRYENVRFETFAYAVHVSSDDKDNPVSHAWSFDNCEFTDCNTPVMLNWANGFSFTGCRIDASASVNASQHCVYLGEGTSNIVVDHCLLENAMGGAINQRYAKNVSATNHHHHNSFTNLQIRNCGIGVVIGSPSDNIEVKNITATNVARLLHLENCTNVTVDNFNASGSFYYTYFRKIGNDITKVEWGDNSWSAIVICGYVDAKISNSFFSTGGVLFNSGPLSSYIRPYGADIEVSLEFDNCIFSTTFSEHRLNSTENGYYQPESYIGIAEAYDKNSVDAYVYDVNFNRCQFYMNSENNARPLITLKGFRENGTNCKLTDCMIAYRDGSYESNFDENSVSTDEENIAERMPEGYFVDPQDNSFVTIENCVFYTNKSNGVYSSEYGFVKNTYLNNSEDNVLRCVVISAENVDLTNRFN